MGATSLLKRATREFKPPERIKVSDWAEKYYQLPETSAEPGRWNRKRAPYQQGIMDAIAEPGVIRVSLMCAAQVGKTIILLAIICYFIDLDPCSMLMTQPTSEMAEIFSKEKLSSAITNVKPVSKKIVQKSRNASSTILMKMFAGGFLRLAGSNSPSSLASMSIRLYLGDEIDKYPPSAGKEGDPVQLAIERTSTFWNSLVFLVSTPSIKGESRIEDEYEKSDKRLCFVPCPHCGHFQHLTFDQLEYPGKGTNEADPSSGVYFICDRCNSPIEEKYKTVMLNALEWRATAKPKTPGHVGFQLSRFYSPWVSWTDIALMYEAARHDEQQLQVFFNATLGVPYEKTVGEKLEWEKLRYRASLSNYSLGTVPDGVVILTAGVDVQKDWLEVAVWGWGKGEQAWLIDYHKIYGDPLEAKVWEELASVVSRDYVVEKSKVNSQKSRVNSEKLLTVDSELLTLKIRATCVDSGYLTQEVYQRVRKFKYLNWFPVKGVSGEGKPLVFRPTFQDINYRGDKIKKGIQLYKIGVDTAKETLYARSQIESLGPKYLNFPNDLESLWFKEFCSEVQVVEHRQGRPYRVWQKLLGVRNEPLDCSVYALAAAYLVGVQRINWVDDEDSSVGQSKVKSQKSKVVSNKLNDETKIKRKLNRSGKLRRK